MQTKIKLSCLLGLVLWSAPAILNAQGSAFTFQGRLTEAGNPASGTYDLQFKLFDLAGLGTGTQQGGVIANNSVSVANGVFTVTLDFGASVFDGSPRFIEVGERIGGSADPYTLLSPRQPVSPTPYAIYSLTAKSAASVSNGAVVTSLNGLKDDVVLAAGANVAITTNGNTLTIDSVGAGGSGIWSLNGADAYFDAGKVGIGTTTPQTKLHVLGDAIRFEKDGKILDFTAGTLTDITARNTSLVIQSLGGGGDNNVILNPFPNSGVFPNGSVGIGTFAPQNKLSIEGGPTWTPQGWKGSVGLKAGGAIGWDANNTSGLRFGIGYTGGGLYMFRTASPLGSNVGGPALYDFMINDAGFVGIGTIAPQTKLHVEGAGVTEATIKSTTDQAILTLDSTIGGQNQLWTLESGLFGTPGLFGIYDRTAVAARLVITPAGNVGVGTATPQAKLDVEASGVNSVVHGKATGSNTGVFGESTSAASGTAAVYGKNLAGVAFAAEGNATQNRDKGGWAKAMLFVEATGEITRAYNGLTGQSFEGPPSPTAIGFSVTKQNGTYGPYYQINFGFRVDDRFVSVTPGYSGTEPATCSVRFSGIGFSSNEIQVFPYLQSFSGGDPAAANFSVIVF